MRSTFLLVLSLLVLATVGGWMLLHPGPAVAPAVDPADGSSGRVVAGGDRGDPYPGSAVASPDADAAAASAGRVPRAGMDGTIRGVVTRWDGAPCAGAVVRAEASGLDEFTFLDAAVRSRVVVASTTAGADGGYALAVTAGRPHLVRAEAAGLAPAARGLCRAGARADFVLYPAAALAGVVADERRQPVPDTRILVQCGGVRSEATTGPDGSYRIGGLPPGEATVDVVPTLHAAPRAAELALVAGAVTRHDVVLLDGAIITGKVLDDATRAGVADAEVREGTAGRTVRTGPDGAFVLRGFATRAQHSLSVRAVGYAPTEAIVQRHIDGTLRLLAEVEIGLVRGHGLRGRVVDAAGAPLAGVYVAAAAADQGGVDGWFRSDWQSQRSGADGRFQFAGLRPGLPYEVVLVRAGFGAAVVAAPGPAAGSSVVDLGDLQLQAGGVVAGTLVDEHGVAVAGQEVLLAGTNADRWRLVGTPPADDYRALDPYVANRRALSDEAGRFQFVDVAAGDYRVHCQRPDRSKPAEAAVAVVAGGVAEVRLALFVGFELAGKVTVCDGGPLPKCYCSVDPEDGQTTSADVEVRSDGTFVATGLQRGNYQVTVYPYGSDTDTARGRLFQSREFAHVAAGTRGFVGEVPVLGLVQGSLRTADQMPAVGCFLVLHDGAATVASTAIGPNGAFALHAPRDGRTLRLYALRDWDGLGEAPLASALLACDTAAGADPLDLVLPRQ
ncbi:MAG: carboxypeptidase regulatory-like domain-containing protein [Planctomycetes bacterium]|nr:carboxypeptidase regulatory-like domain-containing protein [Planctomycetota bacterium]